MEGSNSNSSNTTTATPSDLAEKIKAQVEFYFSDSNYIKDKFLRNQAALDEQGCKRITLYKMCLHQANAMILFLKKINDCNRPNEKKK